MIHILIKRVLDRKELIFLLLFYNNVLWAQDSLFFTGYDLISKDNFGSSGNFIQLRDSSLLLTCIKSDAAHEYIGVRVTRFQSNGAVIWSKLLNTAALENYCSSIETSDSSILIAFTAIDTATTHPQVSLVKLDEQGNLIWSNSIDGIDQIYHCFPVEVANNYFLIFQTHSSLVNDYVADMAKFNSSGTFLWNDQYVISDAFVDAVTSNQTQIILTGSQYDQSYGMFKLTVDAEGNIVSCKKYSVGIADTHSCRIDADGNLIVAGTWNTDYGFILKIDNQDNIVFCKKIDFGTDYDEVWDFVQGHDGNYYVLAEPESYHHYSQTGLIKIDESGNFLWMKVYGDTSRLFPFNILVNNKNEVTIAGTQSNHNQEGKIFLIKVDSNGNSVCFTTSQVPQISDLTITTSTGCQVYGNVPSTLQAISVTSESMLGYSICDTLELIISDANISEQPLIIFPNPASTYINVVYQINATAVLTITNAYGAQVKHLTLYPYFKNRIIYVDDLAAGVYVVQMQTRNNSSVQKMVKE